jgi:hypothetical protein
MKEITDLIGNIDLEKFEKVVANAQLQQTEFYLKVIELHKDERLKSLASQKYEGFTIVPGGYGCDKLFYTDKGFKADIPVCTEPGSYCESGRYESRYYICKDRYNKLIANRKDLLHYFPKLTLEKIIQKIEAGIKALPAYKTAEEIK